MVNISQTKFLDYLFPNAPIDEQLKFEKIYNNYFHQREQFFKSKELIEEFFQSLIYKTFHPEKEEVDEIKNLINDEFLIREFFETIDKSDFQSLEQYDIELERLRKILIHTQKKCEQDEQFSNGIIQILNNKKIQLRINREFKNELLDEATKA